MDAVTVHYFKRFHFAPSAFKKAGVEYEYIGDISYEGGEYRGFTCFVPFSQEQIDLYAFENFTDRSLNRLKRRMELSKEKYVSALAIEDLDQQFTLNKDPNPKNGGVINAIHGSGGNGINLAKIPLQLENKIELIFLSKTAKFLLYIACLIPASLITAYIAMIFFAILTYPIQIYLRKITKEEWDFIFYGLLFIAPSLIMLSLSEDLVREESISELRKSLLRDTGKE